MRKAILFVLLSFVLTGCYTSFQTVETYRHVPQKTYTTYYYSSPLVATSYCMTYYQYYLGDGYIPRICSSERARQINYYVERNVRPVHITNIYERREVRNNRNSTIRSNGVYRPPTTINRGSTSQRNDRVQRNRTSTTNERGRSSSRTRENNN